MGYGANIKKCMSYAYKNKYDYAAMIHGDNQYSTRKIKLDNYYTAKYTY